MQIITLRNEKSYVWPLNPALSAARPLVTPLISAIRITRRQNSGTHHANIKHNIHRIMSRVELKFECVRARGSDGRTREDKWDQVEIWLIYVILPATLKLPTFLLIYILN